MQGWGLLLHGRCTPCCYPGVRSERHAAPPMLGQLRQLLQSKSLGNAFRVQLGGAGLLRKGASAGEQGLHRGSAGVCAT